LSAVLVSTSILTLVGLLADMIPAAQAAPPGTGLGHTERLGALTLANRRKICRLTSRSPARSSETTSQPCVVQRQTAFSARSMRPDSRECAVKRTVPINRLYVRMLLKKAVRST
jgi:hypothetical protein